MKKSVCTSIALLVSLLGSGAVVVALPADAAVDQSAECRDGGGLLWSAGAKWGDNYQASDGTTHAAIESVAWTTKRPGVVPTDSSVRTYDEAGTRVQELTWTGAFDYQLGTVFKVRNPMNVLSAPGRAKVTLTVGVDGDGLGDCTVTFTQPGAVDPRQTAAGNNCIGETVTPESDVQRAVNSAPPGATFCFAPGIYKVGIKPRSGQTFDGGNQAAVLDGQKVRPYAFRADHTSDVNIRGFVVKHYKTPLQEGAIQAFDTTDWTIENNHITLNGASGVTTDTGAKVMNNLIDHNAQQGYAAHGENIVYDGNEIAYNNETLHIDATWEAGGGKSWATKHATFRNNHVHHNGGNGMWDDTNNIYITYDHNVVSDNWGAGIYHEIGYDASITNNIVKNNGTATSQGGGQDLGWLWDAGIQLRSSGGRTPSSPILISGNTVTNNYNGIALLDSPATGCDPDFDEGAYGPCRIRNIVVRNNVVTMNQGATGFVVEDGPDASVFASRNVEFKDNDYRVYTTKHLEDGHSFDWFAWANDWHDWAAWRRYGNDANGSFGR